GRAAPDVDVRAVRSVSYCGNMCAEPLESPRPDLVHRTIGAVDGNAEPVQGRAEALAHEVDVAGGAGGILRGHRSRRVLRAGWFQERLDRLLLLVLELPAAAKELHAVVLRRVVRGRDDGSRRLAEECDRRGRQDA